MSTPNSLDGSGASGSGSSEASKRPASAMASGSTSTAGVENQVLDKKRLQELVREVDPNEQLDEDVEELLLHIADDFIEQTVTASCAIAKHRKVR